MILVLTVHTTANVVQYTIDLQNQQKEECNGKVDIDHVKAAALDKVIVFMNETLPSIAK